MPLDIRSQVITALDNINRNPELYTPPKPTTPLETRINDLKETNSSKYKEYLSTLTSSANSGNEKAKELLGKIGEDAAKQRRGYEGLNQFMYSATGGLLGLVGLYAPRAIGSIWNGHSMFDPKSLGIVTENYTKNHPYGSAILNIAAGTLSGTPFVLNQSSTTNSINWWSKYLQKLNKNKIYDQQLLETINLKNIKYNPQQNTKPTGLDFTELSSNLKFLNLLHDFENKYNYSVSKIPITETKTMNKRAINLLNRHNTFLRGVSFFKANPDDIKKNKPKVSNRLFTKRCK